MHVGHVVCILFVIVVGLQAIEDAEMCIYLQPDWAKGYVRKGNALLQKGDFGYAKLVFMEGMQSTQIPIAVLDLCANK